MQVKVLSDRRELEDWNDWVVHHPDASFSHLAWWMRVLPFPFMRGRIVAARRGADFVGGAALYEFAPPFLGHGVCLAPQGPLVARDCLDALPAILQGLVRFGRRRNAMFLQFDAFPEHLEDAMTDATARWPTQAGPLWRLYDPFRWRDLWIVTRGRTADQILMQFSADTRYRIRQAARKGYEVMECRDEHDLRIGHTLWADAAARGGFAARSWRNFLDLSRRGRAAGQAYAVLCRLRGEPLGFSFNVWAGRGLHGIVLAIRRGPDSGPVARFLNWCCIQHVLDRGFDYFSLGWFGSSAENDHFKQSFDPVQIDNRRSMCLILRPALVSLVKPLLAWQRMIAWRKRVSRRLFGRGGGAPPCEPSNGRLTLQPGAGP